MKMDEGTVKKGNASALWPDRKMATLLVVSVSTFLLPLDYTIVAVALGDIRTSLDASFVDLQWIINGYTITFAAFLLAAGALSDLLGRRRVFLVGLVLFLITSLIAGLAVNPLMLNLARGVQGVGAAIMFSASLLLLAQEFEGRERARAFGVFGAVVGVGAASGPFIAGVLVGALSWRWIFLVNVPIVAVLIALTLTRVRESRDPNAKGVDWGGFLTWTAALLLFIYALIGGNEAGWGSPTILGALVASVALLALFVFLELRHRYPMFDLSLFRYPRFVGANLPPLVLSISFWGIFLYMPLYYQSVLGYSPLAAGLAVLPFAVPLFAMGFVGARLAVLVSSRTLLSLGMLLVGVGSLLLLIANPGSTWAAFFLGSLVSGAGAGLINGEMTNVAMGTVPAERGGMASGINSTMRQLGVALGFAGLGSIFYRQTEAAFQERAAGTPLAGGDRAGELATAAARGDIAGAAESLPPGLRGAFVDAASLSFFAGLQTMIVVAGAVALAGAVATFLLVGGEKKAPGTRDDAPPPA